MGCKFVQHLKNKHALYNDIFCTNYSGLFIKIQCCCVFENDVQ